MSPEELARQNIDHLFIHADKLAIYGLPHWSNPLPFSCQSTGTEAHFTSGFELARHAGYYINNAILASTPINKLSLTLAARLRLMYTHYRGAST